LYGVSLGAMFFGESMFSEEPDASKVALYALQTQLTQWRFEMIDCQIINPHLRSLGVTEICRQDFLRLLKQNAHKPDKQGIWRFD